MSTGSAQRRTTLLILICGGLPTILVIVFMYYSNISPYLIGLTALLLLGLIAYCGYRSQQETNSQFRTIYNLLDSIVQGSYSMRGLPLQSSGAYKELVELASSLSQRLSDQKREAKEGRLLLSKIINHIDIGIIAIVENRTILFANPAASELLGIPADHLTGKTVDALGLEELAKDTDNDVRELNTGPSGRKFHVYSDTFIENGKIHRLVFISDLQRFLQEKERHAWQSLLRVLSHEINNSLSPISGISTLLISQLEKGGDVAVKPKQLIEGLRVVSERAESLSAFIESYGILARLPNPDKLPFSLKTLLDRIAGLYVHRTVNLTAQNDVQVYADPQQFEQMVLNLIKNAHEAMGDDEGTIDIGWTTEGKYLRLTISDQGPGISNMDNIFVPFFSTKKEGSGIGLVLSRQIAINHNGKLSLENREDGKGAVAEITIPHIENE